MKNRVDINANTVIQVDPKRTAYANATQVMNALKQGMSWEPALHNGNTMEMLWCDGDLNILARTEQAFEVSYQVPYAKHPEMCESYWGLLRPYAVMPREAAGKLIAYGSYHDMSGENLSVASYHILTSYWTDGETLIPANIYVFPEYKISIGDWSGTIICNDPDGVTIERDPDADLENSYVVTVREKYSGNTTEVSMDGAEELDSTEAVHVRIVNKYPYPALNEDGTYTAALEDWGLKPVWTFENQVPEENRKGMILVNGSVMIAPNQEQGWLDTGLMEELVDDADPDKAKAIWSIRFIEDSEPISLSGNRRIQVKGFFTTEYLAYSYLPEVGQYHTAYSGEYLSAAGRFYPLRESVKSIGLIAGGSLLLFLLVGVVLIWQLFQVYDREREQEAQRRRTTNAIAHDLKTPMAAIMGYSENLLEHTRPDMEEHFLKAMHTQVGRMNGIVNEMLELSRLEVGTDTLHMELISLKPLCETAVEAYQNSGRLFLLEGNAEIQGDRQMLLRVMDNFLSNAVRHTKDGDTIRISITENRCSVYNPGNPIPEEAMQRLWEAYYQADESRSAGGSGLGLSIAREILERHGFSFGAENVDGGVSFWFQYR